MITGKIVEWNDSKGYGFISASDGKLKVFIHISTIKNNNRRPQPGDEVKFEVSEDDKGRYNATHVTILGTQPVPPTLIFSAAFLVIASAAIVVLDGERLFIALYMTMSVITFTLYALDKNAAKNGTWRTPEKTLHLLSLFGGWPGALCAQHHLQHKSKKQPFKTILWLTIFVNIVALAWTFTPPGMTVMQRLVGNMV